MIESYEVYPIGYVKRGTEIEVRLEEGYKAALLEVDNFSHIIVVWWGDRYEKYRDQVEMQMKPPYAPDVLTGLFATRSPIRPNPINISVCEIKAVDHEKGIVVINIDNPFHGDTLQEYEVSIPFVGSDNRAGAVMVGNYLKRKLQGAGKVAEEGIKIACEQIEELKEMKGIAGVHLMAIEWERKVPEIVERAGMLPRPTVD